MKYQIIANEQYSGSNEIYFDRKPSEEIRDALKSLRMRWHSKKSCWYGFVPAEEIAKAIGSGESKPAKNPDRKEKKNRFGVKVGDIFSASWGWEQTNVDFFQVVALACETSVRVRQVDLPLLSDSPVSSMSSDRTYKVVREILPARSSSVFIKDQENGDLKRIKPGYNADPEMAKENCYFVLDTFANAYKCSSNTITEYESWYA